MRKEFSGSSHTSDFKTGTPVDTLPGAWHHRVSAGTGRPGLTGCEVESLICNFYLSVAARQLVRADPSLRYTCMLLGRSTTSQQTNCFRTNKSYKISRNGTGLPGFAYLQSLICTHHIQADKHKDLACWILASFRPWQDTDPLALHVSNDSGSFRLTATTMAVNLRRARGNS